MAAVKINAVYLNECPHRHSKYKVRAKNKTNKYFGKVNIALTQMYGEGYICTTLEKS